MLADWIKKARGGPDHPMRSVSSAATLLTEVRSKDGVAALDDLGGWLESVKDAEGDRKSVV